MGFLSRHGRRIGITLAPVVLGLLQVSGVIDLTALRRLDNLVYDARLRATMPRTLDERVVVVDIDDKSLAEVGHWPWGRDKMAHLVDELFQRQQAAVVGFDILFGEADESSGLGSLRRLAEGDLRKEPGFAESVRKLEPELDFDSRFAAALKDRPAVLGYYFTHDDAGSLRGVLPQPVLRQQGAGGTPGVMPLRAMQWNGAGGNIAPLAKTAPYAGFMNSIPDADGVIRSVSLVSEFRGDYYESLALAMYRSFRGHPDVLPNPVPGQENVPGRPLVLESLLLDRSDGPQELPVDDQAAMLVSYRGLGGVTGGSFRYVPAVDVLTGKLPAASLKGKLVLVGTTAPGLLDLRVTPVGEAYPGVETHANLLSGMLDNRALHRPDYEAGYAALTLLVAGLVLAFALPLLSVPLGILLTTVTVGTLIGANFWLFMHEALVLPLATPVLAALTAFAINIGYGYFVETRRGRQIATLFGTYVPPERVAEMLLEPEHYSMQAENRELTVMFCDMRGFTAMSESMEPTALQSLLNGVFSRLTEIIQEQRGTIDKYMGDCVMAFWGAPVETPSHARLATIAAIDMGAAVHALNREHEAAGLPSIGIGIGLNTGVMCVGDMGSNIRLAYTVIGDAVNLGSRLEGLCKTYGVELVVSETTQAQAVDDFAWLELDKVMVKGKQQAVTIYTPLATRGGGKVPIPPEWNAMLQAFRTQQWDEAENLLAKAQLPAACDKLRALYAERLSEYRLQPPPADWDGATRFETK